MRLIGLPRHCAAAPAGTPALRERAASALRLARIGSWLIVLAAVVGLFGWAAVHETRSAFLQSLLLSRWAETMTFVPAAGRGPDIRFPKDGPYDRRLGYAALPDFIGSLRARGFAIERQAVVSPELARFMQYGYPPYREKDQAGLTLYRSGQRNGTAFRTVSGSDLQ